MAKLILVGAAALLLLGLVLTWQPQPDAYRDYVQMQQARMQLAQQAADNARWAGFWDVFLPLLGVLALVTLIGLLIAGGWALYERRRPLVQLDALAVPVDRRLLHNGAYSQLPYAILEHRTQAAISAGQTPPHTYSPHVVYNNRQDVQGGVPPAALAAPVAYTPPTFAEMRAQHLLGPGKPLIYGYNAETGQPITGDWRLLQSGAIAGYSGEGKSNTAAFIAGQAYEQGNVKLLLCDPHAASGDDALSARLAPLADAFLLPPAQTDGEIVAALTAARNLVQQRLAQGPPFPFKLLVIIDEFTYLMSRSTVANDAADLVEMIAQEGRKTDTACQVIGQVFGASRSGSTALRDSLQGVIVHRMKRAQARLLVDPESARLAETLTRGRALFSRGADVIPIAIPRCNVEDLAGERAKTRSVHRMVPPAPASTLPVAESAPPDEERGVVLTGDWWEAVAQRTPERAADATASAWDATGRQDANSEEAVEFPNLGNSGRQDATDPAWTPDSVRCYALFCAGYDVSAICKDVLGVDLGKGGRNGQAASRQVQEWIRQELVRRRAQPTEGVAI